MAPDHEPKSGDSIAQSFLLFLLGLLLGTPFTIVAFWFFKEAIEGLVALAIVSVLGIVTLSLIVILNRDRILIRLFGSAQTRVEEIAAPIGEAIQALASGERAEAGQSAAVATSRVMARLGWFHARRWMVGSAVGVLAIFATLGGSALLFRQNELLVAQNEKLERQTGLMELQDARFKKQNAMLERQTALMRSQDERFEKQNEMIGEELDLIEAQTKLVETQADLSRQQTALAEASRRSALIFELTAILDAVGEEKRAAVAAGKWEEDWSQFEEVGAGEIDAESSRTESGNETKEKRLFPLSDALAGRIVALSRSFRPYQYVEFGGQSVDVQRGAASEDDSAGDVDSSESFALTSKPVSPERGQLMVSLLEARVRLSDFLARCDFGSAGLSRASLREADLREADLRGADLSEADLSWANLRGADLSEADLSWADLYEADLIEADLRDADLSWADLCEADLSMADLNWADLSWADLIEADLSMADLSWADLHGADLIEADLSVADLSWADLSGADLRGADLRGADLREADLRGANLSGADLEGVFLGATSGLASANLVGAILIDVDFE